MIKETLTTILVLAGIALVIKYAIQSFKKYSEEKKDFTSYQKKGYLFDTNAEFSLYKTLLSVFGEKYFIFPQINYSHLIEPKKNKWQEKMRLRSRIDRKSADFVFCDKDKILPLLIVELDGYVHNYRRKMDRDEFINQLLEEVGLPIVRIRNKEINRDFIEKKIKEKLENNKIS